LSHVRAISPPRRPWVAAALLALLAGVALPMGTASASDAPVTALLTGTVVKVQPEPGSHAAPASPGLDDVQTLLRLPGGQLTPVTGLEDLPAGAGAQVTVAVPAALDSALEAAAGDSAVDDARTRPAAAASPVARAAASLAASRDLPLAATAGGAVSQASAAGPAAAQTVRVAVVGVNGFTAAAYTDSVVASMLGSAGAYWAQQSGSAITFTQTGAITRYTSTTSCTNPAALWNEAATRTGFSWAPGAHLLLLLPLDAYSAGYCSYGLGTVGSSVSTGGLLYVADTSWPALAHELGHNMSLLHANELACTGGAYDSTFNGDGEPESPSCSVSEYADGLDVMGMSAPSATGGLSSIGLSRLGLVPAERVQQVVAEGRTTVTLPALSTSVEGTGIRVATVTDPRNGEVYYLENRQPSGSDLYGWQGLGTHTWNGKQTGYGLRVLKTGLSGASVLIDPSPSAAGSFDPVAIVGPGTTFTSASGGVRIAAEQNAGGTVTAIVALAATGAVPDLTEDSADAPPEEAALAVAEIAATARTVGAEAATARVTVGVSADGVAASGSVRVLTADGDELGHATLVDGRASVNVPTPGIGRHALSAVYDGDERVSPGTTPVTLVVSRFTSRLRTSMTAATKRQAGSVQVTVLSAGGTPGGTVRLVGSRSGVLSSARLKSGTARLVIPRGTRSTQSLDVVYTGSTITAPSSRRLR
jgi:Bacterial Ig-like domain (group 3)